MSVNPLKDDEFISNLTDFGAMKLPNSYKFPFKMQKGDFESSDNFVVSNLMAELAIALNTKVKLQSENTQLKLENEQMSKNALVLENKILEEKNKCTAAMNNLQEQLSSKDIMLKEQNVNSLEEIREYLSQINDLKIEITELNERNAEHIKEMEAQTENVKQELYVCKRTNEDLLKCVQALKDKNAKYKNKFTFSVTLLQKMNQILQYIYKKRVVSSKKTQTEVMNLIEETKMNEDIKPAVKKQDVYQDNIISELFFKPNPFCENVEQIFFRGVEK